MFAKRGKKGRGGERKKGKRKGRVSLVFLRIFSCYPVFYRAGAYAIRTTRSHLLVAVLEIIPASAPDPIALQVLGPATPGTSARRQLAVPTGTADGVDHSSGGDRVNERGFPARCSVDFN